MKKKEKFNDLINIKDPINGNEILIDKKTGEKIKQKNKKINYRRNKINK